MPNAKNEDTLATETEEIRTHIPIALSEGPLGATGL